MTQPSLDIVAIGDAIVDVISTCDDAFLERQGLTKGSMQLLDTAAADRLYAAMAPAREISGGSAANSMAGVAALGGKAAFIGQVANDQLGQIFGHDMKALGVRFDTPPLVGELPTGAQAGLGARLLAGSYYGQTIQIWAALFAAAFLASLLVSVVGISERRINRRMGVRS